MKKLFLSLILISSSNSIFAQARERILGEDFTLEQYQALKAEAKQHLQWSFIQGHSYTNEQLPSWPICAVLNGAKVFDPEYLKVSFTHQSDEMPEDRTRLIHALGAVAKVKLVRTQETSHTGLFQTGAIGLARLSLASPRGFTPGMGLKLYIDGQRSTNLMVMNSLDGQESKNFFVKTFTNSLPAPTPSLLTDKLEAAFTAAVTSLEPGASARHLSLDPWARFSNDGVVVEKQSAPWLIFFRPTAAARAQYESARKLVGTFWSSEQDFRITLQNIKPGTVLYEVFVKDSAEAAEVKWGELVTTSEFVSSSYGDEGLFFQHHLKKD